MIWAAPGGRTGGAPVGRAWTWFAGKAPLPGVFPLWMDPPLWLPLPLLLCLTMAGPLHGLTSKHLNSFWKSVRTGGDTLLNPSSISAVKLLV